MQTVCEHWGQPVEGFKLCKLQIVLQSSMPLLGIYKWIWIKLRWNAENSIDMLTNVSVSVSAQCVSSWCCNWMSSASKLHSNAIWPHQQGKCNLRLSYSLSTWTWRLSVAPCRGLTRFRLCKCQKCASLRTERKQFYGLMVCKSYKQVLKRDGSRRRAMGVAGGWLEIKIVCQQIDIKYR